VHLSKAACRRSFQLMSPAVHSQDLRDWKLNILFFNLWNGNEVLEMKYMSLCTYRVVHQVGLGRAWEGDDWHTVAVVQGVEKLLDYVNRSSELGEVSGLKDIARQITAHWVSTVQENDQILWYSCGTHVPVNDINLKRFTRRIHLLQMFSS
jgi:long-subunit fatty acid transport protein